VYGFGGSVHEIAEAAAAAGPPIVLGGHSIGASDAADAARILGSRGLAVDVLVLIDEYNASPIPGNVRHLLQIHGRSDGDGIRTGPDTTVERIRVGPGRLWGHVVGHFTICADRRVWSAVRRAAADADGAAQPSNRSANAAAPAISSGGVGLGPPVRTAR
jgi:hypothetical protein